MSRAKAWLPELDPANLALGYPSRKEDGIVFDDHDFITCVTVIPAVATLIGNDTDLTKYSPGYDSENRRIPTPHYGEVNLIPPTRKHTFAPEVDPASLIADEAEFEALNGIDWASSTFQDRATDGRRRRITRNLQARQRSEPPDGYDCKTMLHYSDSGSLVIG